MDLGQAVAHRKDSIIKSWIDRVRSDETITSSESLGYRSVLDSLPRLVDEISSILSKIEKEDFQALLKTGIDHGDLRAQQGYDVQEIVKEYALLRNIIFEQIEPALLESSPALLLRTVRLIDGLIDKVIAACLDQYTEERLREINLLYDEMIASNQELDRLIRNEQTNLAHLAHELKNPLTCIIGYSDLFLRKQGESGELRLNFIEQVLASGRLLLQMVNETLEVSAYKSGQIAINLQAVDVYEVVEEVAIVMKTLAQQKGLDFVIDSPTLKQQILTDRGRLRQIVTNLISNAVRYTESGQVLVSVQQRDEHVEIAIADTGLGIDAKEQARIFEPYYQGRAGQQLPSSTGLGLAIAYQMVKLLQGVIQLESQPGKGSTFTIKLPLMYQSPLDEASSQDNQTSIR